MKIVFKGRMKCLDDLPKGTLPPDAVKFREPETFLALNLAAMPYLLIAVALGIAAVLLRQALHPGWSAAEQLSWSTLGFVLSIVMIAPHELLHAIAFPKHAQIEIWYSIKDMIACCVSTCPTTKVRFVFLSLLPAAVLGFLPLVLWALLPLPDMLFTFSVFSLLYSCGDFMNVKNALTQMPKGSVTQLSGMNSYWYYPAQEQARRGPAV